MARGNIQNDVVQLLDKYKITEILEVIMDIGSDSSVHEMREWFENNFGESSGMEDDLENDAITAIFHDIEHLNMRVLKLERGVKQNPETGDITTGDVPKEIMDAITAWRNRYKKDKKRLEEMN